MKHAKVTIILFLLIYCHPSISSSSDIHRDIPHDNLSYPVLINLGNITASGFLFSKDKKIYFVTSRHCLFKNAYEIIDINPDSEESPFKKELPYDLKSRVFMHPILNSGKIDKIYIEYNGIMKKSDRDILIETYPIDKVFQVHIKSLYKKSQDLQLINSECKLSIYPFIRESDSNNEIAELMVNLELAKKYNDLLLHPNADISAVLIADIKEDNPEGKHIINFRSHVKKNNDFRGSIICLKENNVNLFDDVMVSNVVYIFGYPTSLTKIPVLDIQIPLLRRGIVAGKNNRLKTIILDCPAFRGNSGGLVLQVEDQVFEQKFRAIGVISQFVPFYKGKDFPENSGYSIAVPLDFLFEIIEKGSH